MYFIYVAVLSFVLVIEMTYSASVISSISTGIAQELPTSKTSSTSLLTTAAPTVPTTTLTPKQQCENANSSCEVCVRIGSVQCLWCQSSKKCILKQHVIPTTECAIANAKWAVCWLNYMALIISCSVIGGVIILALVICICCCCCKKNKSRYEWDDAKLERKKDEVKAKNVEKKAERKAKTDAIRRKYGLMKDENAYERLDENARK